MTPETQSPTAARDGFVVYDELTGPDLEAAHWSSTAAWRVDGHRVYEAHGTVIPEHARIGFGIWTMLPIRDGRGRSLHGQGLDARWRGFRVRGVAA